MPCTSMDCVTGQVLFLYLKYHPFGRSQIEDLDVSFRHLWVLFLSQRRPAYGVELSKHKEPSRGPRQKACSAASKLGC